MKILFDIGHPGHVHYFRAAIKSLKSLGHEIVVTARERDIIFYLLDYYKIPFVNRGNGSNTRFGKLLYMLKADLKLIKLCLRKKPDLFISFSSPYAAQAAYLLRRPHIAINDTEHTDKIHSIFTYKFSKWILTPESYQNDLGKKHLKFNNIMEGIYLNSKVFSPDISIYDDLKINKEQPFVFIRFVSWNAHHDFGQSGINLVSKRKLVKILTDKNYRVLISSEDSLPNEFKQYQINISPEKIHSVLFYASLFIGESGTMASESAYLGTQTVYVNSLPLMCYLKLEQDYKLLKHFSSSEGVLEYVKELLEVPNFNSLAKKKAKEMKETFINPTEFLFWMIKDYPESTETIATNPKFQEKFK